MTSDPLLLFLFCVAFVFCVLATLAMAAILVNRFLGPLAAVRAENARQRRVQVLLDHVFADGPAPVFWRLGARRRWRAAAVEFLELSDGEDARKVRALANRWGAEIPHSAPRPEPVSDDALHDLLADIACADIGRRRSAIQVIGAGQRLEAGNALIWALDDDDAQCRVLAVHAVVELGLIDAESQISLMESDADWRIRMAAQSAMNRWARVAAPTPFRSASRETEHA